MDARNGGTFSPLVIFSKRRTQGVSMPTQRMIISQAKRSVCDVKSCFGNSLHSSTTRTEIPYIDENNKNAVAYKKIGILKVRETEFPKNTLRKIMRFKLDMSIDYIFFPKAFGETPKVFLYNL